jgi:glycosyltransferase 2 family protein
VALSVVVMLADATAIWFVLAATKVTLTPMQLALVYGVASLSMLLPTAPGFVGTLQFAYVIGVTSFGFSAAQGIAAATASQLFLLLPLTLVGILLMMVTHVRVAVHLRSSAAHH